MSTKHGFEEAISNMILESSPYFVEYAFYGYIIAQCNVIHDSTLKAPAAVRFVSSQYDLLINPDLFNDMPLQWRIGILKHECLHIIGNHIFRADQGDYEDLPFNYSTDCAINQEIPLDHLPSITEADLAGKPNPKNLKVGDPNCIIPANFPTKTSPVPEGLSAEQYYAMIDKDQIPPQPQQGQSDQDSDSDGDQPLQGPVDDHSTWAESEGIEEIKDQVTKSMLEKSFDQAVKGRGNVPSQYAEWLEVFSNTSQVSWKKLLRRITGSKRANIKPTLLRKNRRTPNLRHIKGHTKERVFDLAVISDVSGSVSNQALQTLWGEILHICKQCDVAPTICQIDTEAHEPQLLKSNTSKIERKAYGGTRLSPAIQKLKDTKTPFNALVVTTDGYLDKSDIEPFLHLNKKVVWLVEAEGQLMSEMNKGKMVGVKLK